MTNEVPRVPVETQSLPSLMLYSYEVIAAPPLEPAVKLTASAPLEAATFVTSGALGEVCAIPLATAEAVPAPIALTARNST